MLSVNMQYWVISDPVPLAVHTQIIGILSRVVFYIKLIPLNPNEIAFIASITDPQPMPIIKLISLFL